MLCLLSLLMQPSNTTCPQKSEAPELRREQIMKKVMHSHCPTTLCALQIPEPQEMSLLYPQTFSLEGCPHVLILPAVPAQLCIAPLLLSKPSALIGQEMIWSPYL